MCRLYSVQPGRGGTSKAFGLILVDGTSLSGMVGSGPMRPPPSQGSLRGAVLPKSFFFQAHVQSGMAPSHPTAHAPMMLMTTQPPPGGAQAALAAQTALPHIPVSTATHFPYMTHPSGERGGGLPSGPRKGRREGGRGPKQAVGWRTGRAGQGVHMSQDLACVREWGGAFPQGLHLGPGRC